MLAGRKVLIAGLGKSGVAAARLTRRHGAKVAVSDARDGEKQRAAVRELAPLLETSELGGHSATLFAWADLIVSSPGVPLALPIFQQARERGVEIIGEVELAFRLLAAPVIGITGTKGKSTTTALVGEMLIADGRRTFVGGNLGTPLAEALLAEVPPEIAVVELSSFQLETIVELRPSVAALLNLAPDHQDRYASHDDYVAAKRRLFARQWPTDAAVLNADDAGVMEQSFAVRSRLFTFGGRDSNAWFAGDVLHLRLDGAPETYDAAKYLPPGKHNRENLAAAALMARLAGASPAAIQQTIETFRGLAHRLETLAEISGVLYVNDSKATTPGAVRTSLRAMNRPVILILGGRDKGGDWSTISVDVVSRARLVFAYGEAAARIAAGLAEIPIRIVGPFAEALAQARAAARPGEAVLLSPGCASFDQFANFEERGEAMRQWVERL
ncbi:MAG: UDP-N-acetylmuramoyl-L-alanine--D-glutamate ligase [Myxococcales bacterium]|nr:UDP-N-acetylmuramoyl-L-alanine--D-glutamate ligase [Myxococcales bacterium]